MKIKSTLFSIFFLCISVYSQEMTGEDILKKMDANEDFSTAVIKAKMVIHSKGKVRTKSMTSTSWNDQGDQKAVTEFTNPEDEGTKYLKLAKDLWIYFPDEDDVMKISGHMLKEGMMGSDVSYEDALENDLLSGKYDIQLLGEETYKDALCYVIELNAKVKKVSYYKRKLWVDKTNFVGMQEELYAKSGKLLKVNHVEKVEKIGSRFRPVHTVVENKLRKNSKTEFIVEDIQLDAKVDKKQFTMRYLRR